MKVLKKIKKISSSSSGSSSGGIETKKVKKVKKVTQDNNVIEKDIESKQNIIVDPDAVEFTTEGLWRYIPNALMPRCLPISTLKLWDVNPRINDDSMLDLASLIKAHGFRDPIVIDQNNVIRAGNTRYKAALHLKMEMVPVAQSHFVNELKARAYAISNNKVAERSKWDRSMLRKLLQAEEITTVQKEYGFLNRELDDLGLFGKKVRGGSVFNKKSTAIGDINDGDVFCLGGKHLLMCGDMTDKTNVKKLFGNKKADIMFTSPEYFNVYQDTRGINSVQKLYVNKKKITLGEYLQYLCNIVEIGLMHCEYTFVNLQMLQQNKKALIELLYDYSDDFVDVIIWDKVLSQPAVHENILNSDFEFIYCFSKKEKTSRIIGCKDFRGTVSNIVHIDVRSEKNQYSDFNSASFPVALPEKFIVDFTNRDSIVFDPMGGTGTTLIAADKTDRICFTGDIEPSYVNLIMHRYMAECGGSIERINK